MLERKITNELISWKQKSDRKPLIIEGVRQCGKTTSVIEFAKKNYKNVIYLNFFENKILNTAFEKSLMIDDITMNISSILGNGVKFEPNNTVLIFDEIQECPDAHTSLKFFKLDGRYDVIATGSLLGVRGYGDDDKTPKSYPVGFEHTITMYPMDFEEFLWANGISKEIIKELKKYLDNESPVPEAMHLRFNELLHQYMVVGGMPEVVEKFIDTKNLSDVLILQKELVNSFKKDMIKYAPKSIKPRIIECFESIPNQLAKEYKKFQYKIIKNGARASQYEGSLKWIEDANIINRSYDLTTTELPLSGNEINDEFKVFICDCGLLIAMCDDGTQYDVLQGNIYTYKGAINENLIASMFSKMNRQLYYFHKDSGLEIDFVIRYKGKCTLVETKAQTGNAKSLRTILNNYDKYHIDSAIKLGNYNVGREGNLLTLPTYMCFLLTDI